MADAGKVIRIPFDPEAFLKIGRADTAAQKAAAEIKKLDREIDKIIRKEGALNTKGEELLARRTALADTERRARDVLRNEAALDAAQRRAGDRLKELERGQARTKQITQGLLALGGSNMLRKLLTGEGLDATDAALGTLALSGPLQNVFGRLGKDSKLGKFASGLAGSLPAIAQALAIGKGALDFADERVQQAREAGGAFGSGRISEQEYALFQKFNRIGFLKDAKQSFNQANTAAAIIAGFGNLDEKELRAAFQKANPLNTIFLNSLKDQTDDAVEAREKQLGRDLTAPERRQLSEDLVRERILNRLGPEDLEALTKAVLEANAASPNVERNETESAARAFKARELEKMHQIAFERRRFHVPERITD